MFQVVLSTQPRFVEWQGVLNTTLEDFLREVEEDVYRDFKLVAMLKKKGNVTYGNSGNDVKWRIQYRQAPLIGIADSDTITFSRQDRHKVAFIDWRGYAAADAVTFKEREMNKGKEAIVDRFAEVAEMLMSDVTEKFSFEPYVNGYATGNSKRFHGMESFLGVNGTSNVAGSPAMQPSATYAGLSTILGNYGGSWSTNATNGAWPRGVGTAEYDFFSPLILDYTNTTATASGGWSSSTATWAARCLEALRFGIAFSEKNKSKRGTLDFIDLDREMYRLSLEALHSSERIMVERTGDEGLVSMGFKNVFNYDGVEVSTEFGIPAGVGYGFNCNQVDMMLLTKQMWEARGPDEDNASMSYRFLVYNFGNFRWRPRYFLKFGAYGSSS
jgi:hypothetical protein